MCQCVRAMDWLVAMFAATVLSYIEKETREEYDFEDQAYKKDFHYFLNDMWVMISFIFNVLYVKSVLLV